MIKGWKNNPAWVAHYKKVEQQRFDWKCQRHQAQMQIEIINQEIESLKNNTGNSASLINELSGVIYAS
jgi:hypothetical protein